MEEGTGWHHQVRSHIQHITRVSNSRGAPPTRVYVYVYVKSVKAAINAIYIDRGRGCSSRVECMPSMSTTMFP
jgi:hypothetical protein